MQWRSSGNQSPASLCAQASPLSFCGTFCFSFLVSSLLFYVHQRNFSTLEPGRAPPTWGTLAFCFSFPAEATAPPVATSTVLGFHGSGFCTSCCVFSPMSAHRWRLRKAWRLFGCFTFSTCRNGGLVTQSPGDEVEVVPSVAARAAVWTVHTKRWPWTLASSPISATVLLPAPRDPRTERFVFCVNYRNPCVGDSGGDVTQTPLCHSGR